jgi:hypothetical protein
VNRFVVGVEVFEKGIHLEATRTDGSGAGGRDCAGAGDEIGHFSGLPEREETGGAEAGGGAAVAIGDGAQSAVDMVGELGEVEGIVAGSLGGTGVDDDDVVSGGVGGELGIALVVAGFVGVQPIDDVAFWRPRGGGSGRGKAGPVTTTGWVRSWAIPTAKKARKATFGAP